MELELAKRKTQTVRRLAALYHDDAKVEVYLARYGLGLSPGMIQECAAPEGRKDPLLSSSVRCPVCGTDIPYWIVKSGTQRTQANEFQIPIGSVGTQEHYSVNPVIYEVIVCPGCLFASTLRSDFVGAGSANREKGLSLTDPQKQGFTERREERAQRLEGGDAVALFARPRDLDSAIRGYQIACDTDVWKCENHLPGARLRLGADRLRVYTLLQLKGEEGQAEPLLGAAHEVLQEAYAEAEDPKAAAPTAYLVLAVSIRIGEATDAARYYQILRKLGAETPDGPDTRGILRWCKMAGELWASWRGGEMN